MNSRERVLMALNHREADRIPFDIGGMAQSGIHNLAYKNLRDYLDMPKSETKILNMITQAAKIDEDLAVFHSCGAVRPVIPDLIEIGVDILNPVQFSAIGMDITDLKGDFGKDLCFWGGGIDTQQVLCSGKPEEIREHVKKNIDILAPGGGFIFSTVHIIQPNVPPQNIITMWDTLQEYGIYK